MQDKVLLCHIFVEGLEHYGKWLSISVETGSRWDNYVFKCEPDIADMIMTYVVLHVIVS